MDDLTQRLRDAHANSPQRIMGSDIFAEAAARIEALEADTASWKMAADEAELECRKLRDARAALEAEVARVTAIANRALDEWASWVHDQLDGTSSLAEAIAEVDAARAALTPPHVQHTAGG